MKTKQIVGILIAGATIIAVGVTGAFTDVIAKKFVNEAAGAAALTGAKADLPSRPYVGVIGIDGEIGPSAGRLSSGSLYDHDMYINYVDDMIKDYDNKGIFLYVDSPGGTVYESDEMYLKLMEYKERTGRPIWAYFAEEACSGGYYISMAADKIYANRNCWTGSIGVIVSLMNCEKLYEKIGIEEIDIASGENKAMGSAGAELTDEQRDILQDLVDEAYGQFLEVVGRGRSMDESLVREVADGRIYSAKQAVENGLIDEIGSIDDAKTDFVKAAGLNEGILFYEPDTRMLKFVDGLLGAAETIIPKSDADIARDIVENNGNGVLKYYAKFPK